MPAENAVLIIVIPLISAFLVPLIGRWKRHFSYFCTIGALATVSFISTSTLLKTIKEGNIGYHMGGWAPPFGIELAIDPLNAMMLVLVSVISLLVAVYSYRSVDQELSDRMVYFYTLYLLQVTGFTGILITGDLFNLYVFLEIASLSGYALIAVGENGAPLACFRYIIMGTIGASFYLLGVGYIYMMTGSLNMADVHQLLPALYDSKVIAAALAFILIGLGIKMALFPLHIWLPDAYTKAPSASSALIAPLMTKISLYVMIRVLFYVFDISILERLFPISRMMVWAGFAAICGGAIMAMAQTDFKRMLCYILVAEVGYIVGGLGLANAVAFRGAILHMVNDAMMTAGLFTVAGIIMYKIRHRDLSDFKGLFQTMPLTMCAFVACALSIIGIPPTCGFFSKWYLIQGGILAMQWPFVGALIASSLINVFLFFRIMEMGYSFRPSHKRPMAINTTGTGIDEAPMSMVIPTLGIAASVILMGLYNQVIVNHIIAFAVPMG